MSNTDKHPNAPQEEVLPPEDKGQQQAQGQAQEQPKPQDPPQRTVEDWKRTVCAQLDKIASSERMAERLLKMAGGDASRVEKNFTAFKAVIMQDDGGTGQKKYFYQCSIPSLWSCFVESMNMQLPFDSRRLVYMIIYEKQNGLEAELDIDYKGFINALNRHYKNSFVECKLVFEKDVFNAEIKDRTAQYVYKPADAFAIVDKDFKGIKGGYCFFSYTDTDGKYTSRLVFLSRTQLLANKGAARTKKVWEAHPKAMAEKSCIREGSKLPFAAIDMDVDIEEVANRHYQLDKPEGTDALRMLLSAQQEVVHGKSDEPNDDKGAANAVDGDAKPTPKTDGEAPEKEKAGVDDGAGGNNQNAAPADNGKPEPAAKLEPAARVDNAGSGSDGRQLEQNQADDKKPALVIDNEPQHADIGEAEFEEQKP